MKPKEIINSLFDEIEEAILDMGCTTYRNEWMKNSELISVERRGSQIATILWDSDDYVCFYWEFKSHILFVYELKPNSTQEKIYLSDPNLVDKILNKTKKAIHISNC